MPGVEAPFFATVELEEGTSQPQLGHGDLWPSCWSNDDQLYTAAGDGMGFGIFSSDVFIAVIEGRPGEPGYRGIRIYGKPGGSDRYTSIAELSVHYE